METTILKIETMGAVNCVFIVYWQIMAVPSSHFLAYYTSRPRKKQYISTPRNCQKSRHFFGKFDKPPIFSMSVLGRYLYLQSHRIVVTLRGKGGGAMDIPVYHYDTLDSTNTQCKRLCRSQVISYHLFHLLSTIFFVFF